MSSVEKNRQKARELGTRMAQLGFEPHDNPYAGVHGAYAKAWLDGYTGMLAVINLTRSERYASVES